MRFDAKRSSGANPVVRFITIVGLAVLIAALLYFTDVIKVLMEI